MKLFWVYSKLIITIISQVFIVRLSLDFLGDKEYGVWIYYLSLIGLFSFINQSMSKSYETKLSQSKDYFGSILFRTFWISISVCILEIIILSFLNFSSIEFNTFLILILYQFFSFIIVPFRSFNVASTNLSFITISFIFEQLVRVLILYFFIDNYFNNSIDLAYLYLYTTLLALFWEILIHFCKYGKIVKKTDSIIKYNYIFNNSIGGINYALYQHGVNIVLFSAFSPSLIAVKGVLDRFQLAIEQFIGTLQPILTPKLSSLNKEGLNNNFLMSMKLLFLVSLFATVPLFGNTDYIFQIWLKNSPEKINYLSNFVLFFVIINSVEYPISQIVRASKFLFKYQILVSLVTILIVPVIFTFYKSGLLVDFSQVYYVIITIYLIAYIVRFYIIKKYKIVDYTTIKKVCLFLLVHSILVCIILNINFGESFFKIAIYRFLVLIMILLINLTNNEFRKFLSGII